MTTKIEYTYVDLRARLRLQCSAAIEIHTLDRRCVTGQMRDIVLHSLYCFTDEEIEDFLIHGEPVTVKANMRRGKSALGVGMYANIDRRDETGLALRFTHSLQWWPIFTMFPACVCS